MWSMRKKPSDGFILLSPSTSSYSFNACLTTLEDTHRDELLAGGNDAEDEITEAT